MPGFMEKKKKERKEKDMFGLSGYRQVVVARRDRGV